MISDRLDPSMLATVAACFGERRPLIGQPIYQFLGSGIDEPERRLRHDRSAAEAIGRQVAPRRY
jgi:hypothetical protein